MINRFKRWLGYCPVPGHRYPFICFGGFVVLYGKWADIRLRNGVVVVRWQKHNHYLYYSPNGTPSRALWMLGRFND